MQELETILHIVGILYPLVSFSLVLGKFLIGLWKSNKASCSILLYSAYFQIQSWYYLSNETPQHQMERQTYFCSSYAWSEVPDPAFLLFGFISRGRHLKSTLVGRSWWWFWSNTRILQRHMEDLVLRWCLWVRQCCSWILIYIRGVRTSVALTPSSMAGTTPTFLIHLGFFSHGDVIDLE